MSEPPRLTFTNGYDEPTLGHIPGILARTGLRFVARIVLGLAAVLLLGGGALLLISATLATFRSARGNRGDAAARLIDAVIRVMREFRRR
jgi:hypothetical protein